MKNMDPRIHGSAAGAAARAAAGAAASAASAASAAVCIYYDVSIGVALRASLYVYVLPVRRIWGQNWSGPVRSPVSDRLPAGPGLGSVSTLPPKILRCQKTKCAESSETGFHQVTRL